MKKNNNLTTIIGVALSLAIIIVASMLFFGFSSMLAKGEEGDIDIEQQIVDDNNPTDDNTEVIDVDGKIDDFASNLIKWIAGIVGSSLFVGGVGILRPYLKNMGENKTLRAITASTKAKIDELTDENKSLKTSLENFKPDLIIEQFSNVLLSTLSDLIKSELDKRTDLSAKVLANTELLSVSISQFMKAATLVWREVDRVPRILSEQPTTEAMERILKENQYMKTLVAERLDMETEELQEKLDKAVEL